MSTHVKDKYFRKRNIMNNLAPIVLFTYNRPQHTQQTVEALLKNEYAAESDLIVYSDGSKDEKTWQGVAETRKYIHSITGFKSIRIIEREKNWGLANNIIDGVTTVVNKYGKIIVMEDDLLAAPYFLCFMNEALNKYEGNDQIASIHGYVYPVKENLPLNFFLSHPDSWAWGTWANAWAIFEADGKKLLELLKSKRLEKSFDFNNSYYFVKMLKAQIKGKNSSWAIRWYASVFLKNKLCLYPHKSLIYQNGMDGSGTHCSDDDWFDVEPVNSHIPIINIPVEENLYVRKAYEVFFKTVKLTYQFKIKNLAKKMFRKFFKQRMIKQLSYYYKILRGKEIWIKPQIKRKNNWIGSKYGGFYICPELLKESSIVYSFGVGEDISFDIELINQFACTVYAFDPTPKSIKFIENYGQVNNFYFFPIGLHRENGQVQFFLPLNPDHVSGTIHNKNNHSASITVPVKKFSTIAEELKHNHIELIKMDIEGSEYDVIDDILNANVEVSQILIEVHHRFAGIGIKKTKELIKKLNSYNYKLSAISPSKEEYTFVKI